MTDRKGDWFQTYTGKAFWLLDPRPEDVCIEDIARGLAYQCRFNGHTKRFFSIAQHSVLVSQHVGNDRSVQLWGLLHDAAEAYLGDMVRPLKLFMPEYREAEARVTRCIVERFGLSPEEPMIVKSADNTVMATEKRDLMGPSPREWWAEDIPPLPGKIDPLPPPEAELLFWERFKELT
jgi:hypothetical protein